MATRRAGSQWDKHRKAATLPDLSQAGGSDARPERPQLTRPRLALPGSQRDRLGPGGPLPRRPLEPER
jgi:hypothetical protein